MADHDDDQDKDTDKGDKGKTKPDLSAQAKNLATKHGGADAALAILLMENKQYRDEIRTLRAKLPDDDSVVLSGDDADRWAAYQELGKPEEIKKSLRENADRGTRLARLERESEVTRIERIAGFVPGTLGPIAGDLQFEVKEETRKEANGKESTVETVHVKGEDDKTVPIRDHARIKPYLAALESASARPRGTPPRESPRPELPPGEAGDRASRLRAELRATGSGAF